MHDRSNFEALIVDAIDDEIGRACDDELTEAAMARRRRKFRKPAQKIDGRQNPISDTPRARWALFHQEGHRSVEV